MATTTTTSSTRRTTVSTLPLKSLNHISRNCKDLEASLEFYEQLLGFVRVKRPGSLNFAGAWLFNYGIGIHLLQVESNDVAGNANSAPDQLIPILAADINPRNNHISFQCDDMTLVEQQLHENGVKYIRRVVVEDDIEVDQLFFHDPDENMIEICNCENLPVEPIIPTSCLTKTAPAMRPSLLKKWMVAQLSSLLSTDIHHFPQKLEIFKSSLLHWWVSVKFLWI